MTNVLRHKLLELRQQLTALQESALEDPQVRELCPGVLAGLQRSLAELQAMIAGEDARADPEALGPGVGRPDAAWPGHGQRIRTVAEQGQVLVRVLDTETRCRWVNRAWLDFTGRSMKQLRGMGWLQDVHPEDRDRCARVCREAFVSGQLYRMEYRLRREGGEHGWVLEIGTPRITSHGSVGGFVGTAIEVTERKQAEIRLALQYAVARVLSEAKSLEEAVPRILQVLCDDQGWEVAELWSIDPKERVPRCTYVWSAPSIEASELRAAPRTRLFPPCAGPEWQSGQPAWIADLAADETLALGLEARLGLHGMFRLPISANDEILAVLQFFCRRIRPRDGGLVEFVSAVGVQLGQFLERQRSADRIRESEARKSAVLEASLDAVITIDHLGQVVEFNSAAEAMFGYPRKDVVGRVLVDLIVPLRMRAKASASFARFWDTGTSALLGKRFNATATKADGSEFPVEVALAPIRIADPPLLTIYVCDVTARKAAEQRVRVYQERLRSLMTDLLLAEEQERRRLAIDLHDGLSQTIALAQIKLSTLRRSMDGKLKRRLDEIEDLIQQTDRAARSISSELSPPVLHDLGLEPAVQWLVENIRTRYGIEIVLENDGRPKPADETTRVILFRSIRELLINAAKHAGARHVHVRLEREEDHLSAAVEDDGVGMEPQAEPLKGSGLFSIQERLSHVGGSMRIESAPGRGTKIRLCAPLTHQRPMKATVEA